MKSPLRFVAVAILATVPLFIATASPESAPGIQKKTLEIFNVRVVTTATTVTISWETNVSSMGVVNLSDFGIIDDKTGTRHSITIPGLVPGGEYHFIIQSFSDRYGAAAPYSGGFTL